MRKIGRRNSVDEIDLSDPVVRDLVSSMTQLNPAKVGQNYWFMLNSYCDNRLASLCGRIFRKI